MKVLYVASEAAPFVKTGGLGDVAGSLPRALKKDCDIRVVLPLYGAIPENLRAEMKFVKSFHLQLAWRNQYCGIFECLYEGLTFYFIDNEYYFKRREIYGAFDDAERFAFFSKAALDMLAEIGFCPDVIHVNDWQTALIPIYLKLEYSQNKWFSGIKTLFTIHNIQYQGQFSQSVLEDVFGLSKAYYDSGFLEYSGGVNLMKAAVFASDLITTVSPSYAEEIQSEYYAHGLNQVLSQNAGKLSGILNGIDTELHNPLTDPHIFKNYGPETLHLKLENKRGLMKLLGLCGDDNAPVLSVVSRLVAHKGLDLVEQMIENVLHDDVRLCVLGTGEWRYEQFFKDLKTRYPGKVSASIMFSSDLASKIYAGSDMLLMPSRSEPCGLSQLIAMRYGTVPVVRRTGGLRDTVTPYDGESGAGLGFTFDDCTPGALLDTVRFALSVCSDKNAWASLMHRALEADFGWQRSAGEYLSLYKKLQ